MAKMVKLTILKPYNGYNPGDTYEDSAECARVHVALGNAEYYKESVPEKKTTTRAMTPRKTPAKRAPRRITLSPMNVSLSEPKDEEEKEEEESAPTYSRRDMRAED